LQNLHNDKQIISFGVEGDYKGAIEPTEKEKIIAKDDIREIFFTVKNPTLLSALGNFSSGYLTVEAENGYVKKIPINLALNQEPVEESSLMVIIIISIVTILIIGIVIARFVKMNKEAEAQQNSQNDDEFFFDDDLEFK